MSTTDRFTRTWVNVDAGPRMTKAVKQALGRLKWEGQTFVRLTGVLGQPEGRFDRTVTTSLFEPQLRPDVEAAWNAVGDRYGWQITAKNYRAIIADLDAARARCAESRPVHDERITPEEDAERKAQMAEQDMAHKAVDAVREVTRAEVLAKRPPGAHAVVVAELKEDTSDPMTDYFANRTVRSVAIGWRFSKREDFRQLRAAAATFPETAHLGPDAPADVEHRDNYSMGAGNYLSDHGWDGSGSGWVVRSYPADETWWSVDEVHLPEPSAPPVSGSVAVRPSSIGRPGVVEIVFAAKPSAEVRASLKAHGFRWAPSARCWYGRDAAYAEQLAKNSEEDGK